MQRVQGLMNKNSSITMNQETPGFSIYTNFPLLLKTPNFFRKKQQKLLKSGIVPNYGERKLHL
jgi:hypothetical protein